MEKEYEGKVHVKIYKAGKDFDYIPKYGAVTKSMVVINEKKAVTKLTKPAIRKAFEEAQAGATVVMLIPARTDTSYFHDYIYGKAEIRFLRGRLRFEDEDGTVYHPAPFPSMVVIYNKQEGGA